MRKSWLLCVWLGTLAWGQAAPGTPPPAQGMRPPGSMVMQQPPAAQPETAASVPASAAVITITGICPAQPKTAAAKPVPKPASAVTSPAAKTPRADCKTVITKAQFEKLASSLAPNITPPQKKQLGGLLPQLIIMSDAAKKRGLDKTPEFEEKLKFARMQILNQEVRASIQAEAAKVPPEEIANYYKEHPDAFEQFNLDRLFVPRSKQPTAEPKEDDDKNKKLTEEEQKAKQAEEKAKADEAELAMSKLAESLRARAAAGEDMAKLQKEAFEAAGMKIESPTVNLPKVRRTGLPPTHAAVFELKAGEVSQVINDANGHYIYKVNSTDVPPLDQVKAEINSTLQNQRMHALMDKLNSTYTIVPNEAYFGPPGPAQMPPPRIQNRRNAPSPMAPATQPQTPPPAQTPDAKPN
jgi:hypothetical protein